MKPLLPLTAFLLLGLTACGDAAPETTAPDAEAPAAPMVPMAAAFNERAVWNGSTDACRAQGQTTPPDQCLIAAIEAGGGSVEAATVARVLSMTGDPGYVSAWRQEGPVGVATVTYPFRANTNEETRLVPAAGVPVNVERLAKFESDPAWTGFLASHPGAFPVAPAELKHIEPKADGRRFVFATPLRTCRACETAGTAEVAYDFDASGAETGRTLLSVR